MQDSIKYFFALMFVSVLVNAHNDKKDLIPYIVQSNPVNLQEVRINIENYQPTNKPVKKFEIAFGDGKKETKNEDVFYKYKNKGVYNLVIKTWDAQNKLTTYQKELNLDKAQSVQDVPNSRILGPMWIKENKKYKLSVQNEDQHYLLTLTKLPNWNNFFGFKWYKKNKLCKRDYNVEINNIDIFKDDEVNCQSTEFKRIVKLTKESIIKLEGRGHSFKYWWREGFKIEIHAVNILSPQQDTIKPILLSSLSSNAITNNPNVQISVQDVSNTITKVWNSNQELLFETPDKTFNLNLQEGVNNFVIQAEDAFGNKSEFLNLSNIILDTKKPIISLSLNSEYIYSTYPQSFNIQITTNEDVQRLTINNQDALQVGPRSFSYTLNVTEPQLMNFSIKAYDVAGNESLEQRSINFGIDNIAPVISSALASNQFTNQQVWPVVITDNSSVSTEVYRDEVLLFSTDQKSFELSLNEGVNNFRIRSVDEYGNETNLYYQNINLDTTGPNLAESNIQNSYSFSSLPQQIVIQIKSSEDLQSAKVNGASVDIQNQRDVIYSLLVDEAGSKTIQIELTDLAGNVLNQNYNIEVILNVPLLAEFVQPLNGQIFETDIITVQIVSNKLLSSLKLNGNIIAIAPDGLSATKQVQLSAGSHRLSLEATSVDGEVYTSFVDVQVNLRSVAAWDYQECSVE